MKKEIEFLQKELRYLSSIFQSGNYPKPGSTAPSFTPPCDSPGACLDYLKRVLFKLASAIERVHYFMEGRVRARSVLMEVFPAELQDTINMLEHQNPFDIVDQPKRKNQKANDNCLASQMSEE